MIRAWGNINDRLITKIDLIESMIIFSFIILIGRVGIDTNTALNPFFELR